MDEPLTELAAYFRRDARLPDQELVRLTAAARADGSRWDDIAAACGIKTYNDLAGVIYRITGETGAELLFSATQYAVEQLTGSERRFPPLTWACPGLRGAGHRPRPGRPACPRRERPRSGCARLARDQAADDQRRRDQLPHLILHSEPAVGPVHRHWLRERITEDCPRCGWRGYFHYYITTIDGDWAAAVCDDCYADLHPDTTVTVRYFSASYDGREPFGAIRQRTRSDHDYPDITGGEPFPDRGQIITWQLAWEFTPLLVEETHGGADADIAEISREEVGQIAAELAAQHWPPDAARLPWVVSAYPES